MVKKIEVDIAIIGGGIAGLWALNRLQALGYETVLLEAQTLGGGQTICSQGIIHGGIKYALKGFLSNSSNSIKSMPKRWGDCLQGQGEIDLSAVNILSKQQLLWSTGGIASELTSFFASKALKSRVEKLKPNEYPTIFDSPTFKGTIYRLNEMVLDAFSLVQTLAAPHLQRIFKVTPSIQLSADRSRESSISHLVLNHQKRSINLSAKRYLLMAGEGNAALTHDFAQAPLMQTRPLHMVLVQLEHPYPLFAHCLEQGVNPRITITSHLTKNGKSVWYLGGQLAEDGVHKTTAEQIKQAQFELHALFPWLDLTHANWSSFRINRAEPKQSGEKRPDSFFAQPIGNSIIAWPTKLALVPLLTDQIITTLNTQEIIPSSINNLKNSALIDFADMEKPSVAIPIWDTMFN